VKKYLLLISTLCLFACAQKKYPVPHIVIATSYGDIEAELYPDKAPKTVAAFLSYIDSGFYKQSSFYRVLKRDDLAADFNNGVIQGGIWQSNSALLSRLPGIIHESTKQTGLSHTNGTISLARTGDGTANTEFFICIGDQTQFDSGRLSNADRLGYAAFGKIVNGMDAVRKIQSQPSTGESFNRNIEISNIRKL
jgi:peptidyl-prolyl cis-trans isomerase A (cyclophilin A)